MTKIIFSLNCVTWGFMFITWRLLWCLHASMRIYDKDPAKWARLPGVKHMAIRVWIWDMERFLEGERRR